MVTLHQLSALLLLFSVGQESALISQDPMDQVPNFPVEMHYMKIGSPFTLNCEDPSADRGGQLEWRKNNTQQSVNGHLSISSALQTHRGLYTCHFKDNEEVLRAVNLQPGYPPGTPVVHCRSNNYPEEAQCNWYLENETHIPTNFTATYRHGLFGEEQGCLVTNMSCVMRGFALYSTHPYIFNVTAWNPLGRKEKLLQFVIEHIVKPDPPEDLMAWPSLEWKRQLDISWQPPHTWQHPILFPLKYQVQYSWSDGKASRTTGPYEVTSIKLKGLRPRTTYSISVSAKDFLDNGEASDWSPTVTATTN
ncbi:interleukin-27 subunit beta [Erpetoichthys calabaricus]|uniref:Epstein-Barr virus induced 3 n=1 Tax=Erpetoichthys calabaricus TaxID=27687 RepID=A0A8C4XGJ6_ERPCA|nr:interleukin-27 subunit beta [Erpetoichthys calabaricus]XP_028672316.1 interleukin-27 subunit beta [Erpetoichthys calabaricus]XP_051791275.1 interleukin-27 subunit beta [Erpetoichthys calabaricus]